MQIQPIFVHHTVDDVTRYHWSMLQKFSSVPPLAISTSSYRLNGGALLSDWPNEYSHIEEYLLRNPHLRARCTDLYLKAWFENRNSSSDIYFVLEWDTLVNCDINRWLEPVLSFPLSAPRVRYPSIDKRWPWFKHVNSLPKHIRPFACGITPFSCVAVSHNALEKICCHYPWNAGTGNGELRFASISASCGFVPVSNPSAGPEMASQVISPVGIAPAIYHPIKYRVEIQPAELTSRELTALIQLVKKDYRILEHGFGKLTFLLARFAKEVLCIDPDLSREDALFPLPANITLFSQPDTEFQAREQQKAPDQLNFFARTGQLPDLVIFNGPAKPELIQRWASRTLTVVRDINLSSLLACRLRRLAGCLSIVEPLN